jgi:nucleoid-associated protein YgaU
MPTMRKDLRVGLGIGGVLLAVLVVAIIVRSHGKDKTKLAKGDATVQTDPTDGTGEPTPPGDGTGQQNPSPEAIAGGAPGDGPNGKKSDPFDPEGPTGASRGGATAGAASPSTPTPAANNSPDDWEKILNASSSGPIHSLTPAPGAPTGHAAKGRDKNSNLPPGLYGKDRANGNDGANSGANGTEPITVQTSTGGSHASPGAPRTHVIKTGETFTSIARSVYGDGRYYLQILKANPGLEPSALKPGTRINLPDLAQVSSGESRTPGRTSRNARGGEGAGATAAGAPSIDRKTQYKVESGDSLYKIAEKLYGDGTRMDALYEANKQAIGPDPRKLKLGMVLKLPEQPTVASAGR